VLAAGQGPGATAHGAAGISAFSAGGKGLATMGLFDYPTESGQEAPIEDINFLGDLDEADWKKILSLVETRRFRAGEDVIRAGEMDDSFYILTEGNCEVIVPGAGGNQVRLSVIAEGSVFGEVAFFDKGARSATIRGVEKGTVIRITRKNFEHLAAWEPMLARRILFDLGKALAVRLRYMTSLKV
jgi:CRP-like cAMP-binding protein